MWRQGALWSGGMAEVGSAPAPSSRSPPGSAQPEPGWGGSRDWGWCSQGGEVARRRLGPAQCRAMPLPTLWPFPLLLQTFPWGGMCACMLSPPSFFSSCLCCEHSGITTVHCHCCQLLWPLATPPPPNGFFASGQGPQNYILQDAPKNGGRAPPRLFPKIYEKDLVSLIWKSKLFFYGYLVI